MAKKESAHESHIKRGMDDVVVDTTKVSWVDGENGKLYYRGISVDELAFNSNYEECAYLLMSGQLPDRAQLEAFAWKLRQMMAHVPEKAMRIIQELPKNSAPLHVLQATLAGLACINPEQRYSDESILEKGMRIVAQTPVILAAAYRHSFNFSPVRARQDFSFTENFIYMLTGKTPDPHSTRVFESALIAQMDHGFNPSTFSARAVASTLANMYSATSAAVGALSGALHGGASELVVNMTDEAIASGNPRGFVRQLLEENGKVMGMGHRVYKAVDPRAEIFETLLREYPADDELNKKLVALDEIRAESDAYFAEKGKRVHVNVDFWSGALYQRLGIFPRIFSGIFACARMSGWVAHIIELRQDNRLYRPRSQYTGDVGVRYVPLSQRN